jgi:hypothetical protein
MPDTLKVIYLRFPVPSDRRPRRIMPGDYFAVMVGEVANYGKLATVVAYTDGGTGWTGDEIDMGTYYNCPRVKDMSLIPQSLIDYLEWNPDGDEPFKLVVRKRITDKEKREAWRRPAVS